MELEISPISGVLRDAGNVLPKSPGGVGGAKYVLVDNPLAQPSPLANKGAENAAEAHPADKMSLESWFPLRKPLVKPRAGSGRQTSNRPFKLQLRYLAFFWSGVHILL